MHRRSRRSIIKLLDYNARTITPLHYDDLVASGSISRNSSPASLRTGLSANDALRSRRTRFDIKALTFVWWGVQNDLFAELTNFIAASHDRGEARALQHPLHGGPIVKKVMVVTLAKIGVDGLAGGCGLQCLRVKKLRNRSRIKWRSHRASTSSRWLKKNKSSWRIESIRRETWYENRLFLRDQGPRRRCRQGWRKRRHARPRGLRGAAGELRRRAESSRRRQGEALPPRRGHIEGRRAGDQDRRRGAHQEAHRQGVRPAHRRSRLRHHRAAGYALIVTRGTGHPADIVGGDPVDPRVHLLRKKDGWPGHKRVHARVPTRYARP